MSTVSWVAVAAGGYAVAVCAVLVVFRAATRADADMEQSAERYLAGERPASDVAPNAPASTEHDKLGAA